jgi:hypothetical protein
MKRVEVTNKVKETKKKTCRNVIICEIIVHLLVIVQNKIHSKENSVLECGSLYLSSTGSLPTT